MEEAVTAFVERYRAYFQQHSPSQAQPKREMDPIPRVVLVPGLGLFGLGRTSKDAGIAADIAESTVATVAGAEAIGTFESIAEADAFDVEYWSLEQAKLGKTPEGSLAGQIAVVPGAGGVIGAATAAANAAEGAQVAILDIDEAAARLAREKVGGGAISVQCDGTDAGSVRAAFDEVCEAFGGVDIVVSNAGAAWQGKIGDVSDQVLRKSFELNFFAHQTIAQNAVRVMRAQDTGGTLLFTHISQISRVGAS